MSTSSPVITAEALCKTYREGWLRRRQADVLKGVSFEVRPGEIFGLLGPNGAGKTTFIKILLGIVRRTSGHATVLGYSAGDRRSRREIGYLPEHLRIARHHTARSALEYYGQLSGLSLLEIRKSYVAALDAVGLADRANDSVAKYSKGMLQRLGLAQALLHDPRLVILDEPTDGLDPPGRAHVRQVMKQLKESGKTVFVNSHILQEMELVCDRVAIMHQGSVRYVGPVSDLTAKLSTGPGLVELELELRGEEAVVRDCLAGHEPQTWLFGEGNLHSLALRVAGQDAIDQLVDKLRASRVSVLRLSPRRVSLEDAFLAVVKGN